MNLERVELSSLADVRSGGRAPQESSAFTASGHPFIRAGSLPKLLDGANGASLEKVQTSVAEKHGLKLFPAGTVVFAKSGMSATKGHIYCLRQSSYVVNHLAAVVPHDLRDSGFLVRALQQFPPTALIRDPAYPSIRLGDIKNMIVLAPHEPADRQRIATVLDLAEELITKRRAAIAHLSALTQAIFHEMFDFPAGCRDDWPTLSISDVTTVVTKGTTPTTLGYSYTSDGVVFVRAENLNNGALALNQNWLHISDDADAALKRSRIAVNDVLLSIAGTVGRVAIVPSGAPRMNCNQAVAILRPSTRIHPRYLMEHLRGRLLRRHIERGSVTGTITNLSLGVIRSFPVALPPIGLQREFARRVASVERLQVAHRESLAQLETLFAALRQRAFSGEL